MSETTSTIKQKLDELNSDIVKLISERERLLDFNNIDNLTDIAEYELNANGEMTKASTILAKALGFESQEELFKYCKDGSYTFNRKSTIKAIEEGKFIINNPTSIKNKEGKNVKFYETCIKLKSKNHKSNIYRGTLIINDKTPSTKGLTSRMRVCDQINTGVILHKGNVITYANPEMARMLNIPDGRSLIGHEITEIISDKYKQFTSNHIRSFFDNPQKSETFPIEILANNKILKVEYYSAPAPLDDEMFCMSVFVNNTEIINYDKFENELLWSLDELINTSTMCVLSINENGTIIDANIQFVQKFHTEFNYLINKNLNDIGHPENPNLSIEKIISDCKKKRVSVPFIITLNKDIFCAEMFFVPIKVLGQTRIIIKFLKEGKQISKAIPKAQTLDDINSAYNIMFDNPLCGMIISENEIITRANRTCCKILNIKQEDILGHKLSEFFSEVNRAYKVLNRFESMKKHIVECEFGKDGNHLLLEMHSANIDNNKILSTFFDITAIEKNIQSLKDTNNKYKSIIKSSPGGIVIGDSKGNLIEVSDRFCEIGKFKKSDIIGRNISDGFFTNKSIVNSPLRYDSLNEGKTLCTQRELICGDGTLKIIEMYSCAIPTNMYMSIYLDITERKILEHQAKTSQEKAEENSRLLEIMMQSSNRTNVIFDENLNIIHVFVGKKSIIAESDIDELKSYVSTNKTIRNTAEKILKNGGEKYLYQKFKIGNRTLNTELYIATAEFSLVLSIIDNTERQKMIDELNNALDVAKQSEGLKTAFLASLSHEVRTPMNSIIGFTDILRSEETNEENMEYYDIITNSTHQLLEILDDTLEMAKIESKGISKTDEIVEINNLIESAYNIHKPKLLGKNAIEYRMARPNEKEIVRVITDITKVRQLLLELLNNATKYTHEGFIEIGYALDTKYVTLYVKDSGIGISEENIPNIFNRFFRVKQESNVKGSGLGLAIAQTYAEILDTKIDVTSELGVGSCFSLKLKLFNL